MRYRALAWLLSVLLLLSACAAQGNEARTTEEATPVAATVPQSTAARPFGCDALFFGDSITCDGNFAELFPDLRVVNLGVYGDTIEDLQRRVPKVAEKHPAKIFVMVGINDLFPGNAASCAERYRKLLEDLLAACPDAELCIESVLPVSAEVERQISSLNAAVRDLNERLKALAAEYELPYLDIYSAYERDGALNPELTRDGVHLNFNAYGPWAELLRAYLGD